MQRTIRLSSPGPPTNSWLIRYLPKILIKIGLKAVYMVRVKVSDRLAPVRGLSLKTKMEFKYKYKRYLSKMFVKNASKSFNIAKYVNRKLKYFLFNVTENILRQNFLVK